MRKGKNLLLVLLTLSTHHGWAWWGSAGKVEITPDLSRPVYLAGYGAKGRKATGVQDPLWARGIAISDGNQAIILIALDLIGLPRPYVERIRGQIEAPPVPYILIASIHTHSGPDTLGLWGPKPGISGLDPIYMDRVVQKVSNLARRLLTQLEPVEIFANKISVPVKGIVRDLRDPVIIDNKITALKFISSKNKKVVATLINWACHPEVLGKENTLITPDYAGYLVNWLEKKMGGTPVFFVGAIGGLMSPDSATDSFEEAQRIGEALAQSANQALSQGIPIPDTRIIVSTASVELPVDNNLYLALLGNVSNGRPLYDRSRNIKKSPYWNRWHPYLRPFLSWMDRHLFAGNRFYLETEVGLIQVGAVSILAIPGELFPELAIGGYQGEYRFHHLLTKAKNPKPPSLNKAPKGPYLKEQMPGSFHFLIGLANDEIGYIVPEYDFKINILSPFLSPRPKGHHYEETNSLGKETAPRLIKAIEGLLRPIDQ